MTKPHFDRFGGVWCCRSRLHGQRVAGFGLTVAEAWADYMADKRRVWLALGLPMEGGGA